MNEQAASTGEGRSHSKYDRLIATAKSIPPVTMSMLAKALGLESVLALEAVE